jgi:hypothetical protein
MTRTRKQWMSLMLGMVTVLGHVGCARVKPYERERLAQPDMEFEVSADLVAGREHATDYREGSVGGFGGGGGGCGCN